MKKLIKSPIKENYGYVIEIYEDLIKINSVTLEFDEDEVYTTFEEEIFIEYFDSNEEAVEIIDSLDNIIMNYDRAKFFEEYLIMSGFESDTEV